MAGAADDWQRGEGGELDLSKGSATERLPGKQLRDATVGQGFEFGGSRGRYRAPPPPGWSG
eukprot:3639850-Prymnesium_polylepis.3